jgi:hypothetical protein
MTIRASFDMADLLLGTPGQYRAWRGQDKVRRPCVAEQFGAKVKRTFPPADFDPAGAFEFDGGVEGAAISVPRQGCAHCDDRSRLT